MREVREHCLSCPLPVILFTTRSGRVRSRCAAGWLRALTASVWMAGVRVTPDGEVPAANCVVAESGECMVKLALSRPIWYRDLLFDVFCDLC